MCVQQKGKDSISVWEISGVAWPEIYWHEPWIDYFLLLPFPRQELVSNSNIFSGIPATLNYISLDGPYQPSPKLNPYPSWAGNELGNCNSGLNTVYRIKADKCDRLWVLDTGTYGYGWYMFPL